MHESGTVLHHMLSELWRCETIMDLHFKCLPHPHIHLTFPQMINTSLDLSKRWWVKRLSGQKDKCNRWCMSDCGLDQKTSSVQEPMHTVIIGNLALNITEIMSKDYAVLRHFCFNKLCKKENLRVSLHSLLYYSHNIIQNLFTDNYKQNITGVWNW